MPLVFATGAGQEGRHSRMNASDVIRIGRSSVGTAVAGGMLFATFLNILLIPVLYVLVRTAIPGRAART
jgi:multidrug efflux pump